MDFFGAIGGALNDAVGWVDGAIHTGRDFVAQEVIDPVGNVVVPNSNIGSNLNNGIDSVFDTATSIVPIPAPLGFGTKPKDAVSVISNNPLLNHFTGGVFTQANIIQGSIAQAESNINMVNSILGNKPTQTQQGQQAKQSQQTQQEQQQQLLMMGGALLFLIILIKK